MEQALQESELRLRSHLENTPLAVVEWDQDFVVTRWAGEAEAMFGRSAEETVGRPIMDLHMIYDEDIPIVERTMAKLTDGEHSQVTSSNRNVTKDGRVIDCTWYNSVLLDAQGTMRSVMSVVEDHTERRRAEELLHESARLGEALTAIDALVHSLDPGKALEAALSEGTAALGASLAVVTSRQSGGFRIEHLFGAATEETGRVIGRVIPDEHDAPGLAAMASREPVIMEEARSDPLMSQAIAEEFGVESLLIVPLVREAEAVGCLYFVFQGQRHAFPQAEVDFARRLAASLSLALENAGRFEAQRDIATVLQQAIMHALPDVEGIEFGIVGLAASAPALVGGDFWDVFKLADDKLLVVVGDVAGKGVAAAAAADTVHSTMRAFATVDNSPAFILRKTNDLLRSGDVIDSFATALVAVIDTETWEVRLASAGHPGPVRTGRSICELIEPAYGPPLGTFDAEYRTTSLKLAPGESLALYTDGVTEARQDGKLFGEGHVVGTVCSLAEQSAQDIADGLASAASTYADALRDDLQVWVVRRSR